MVNKNAIYKNSEQKWRGGGKKSFEKKEKWSRAKHLGEWKCPE